MPEAGSEEGEQAALLLGELTAGPQRVHHARVRLHLCNDKRFYLSRIAQFQFYARGSECLKNGDTQYFPCDGSRFVSAF